MPAIAERPAVADAEQFLQDVVLPCRPVVLRGQVAAWPVVRAGSPQSLRAYLARFDKGAQMDAFLGAPEIAGKYFYGDGADGFNFDRRRMRLAEALDQMLAPAAGTSLYVGSVPVEDYLPGLAGENPMPLLPHQAAPRIWLGNASNVSSHYDTVDNLACVICGTRRFTLYAPELIDSLYVGPIDHTMAGQPVSLAASSPPDATRYPKFEAVRGMALTAELQPGDAIYIPKLWWHQVQATAPFNGLVNYWWDAFAVGPDAPHTSMLLAMIAIAERPQPERRAWKALFDHYVFRENGHPLAHLPPERHGMLGPLKENYGRIRARVMLMLRGG